jgi:ELWxxDGT repeat protein
LFFTADDGVHGNQLWKSDGTATGTVMVTSFPFGIRSYQPLTAIDNEVFFAADDGTHGTELWKSDGTASGTVMVADISPGLYGSYPEFVTNIDGTLYFSANDGVHGSQVWKSDGTTAGTVMVSDVVVTTNYGSFGIYPFGFTKVRSTIFFDASDSAFGLNPNGHGFELWKTDGTVAGTAMVKDINPGPASSYPGNLTAFNGALYFGANDGVHGDELWTSDGTAAGTVLVKDINPNPYAGSYPSIVNLGDVLLMSANDGTHGTELWTSDGTTAGTVLLTDINPGPASSINYLRAAVVHGIAYFSASDGTHGQELWKSAGTAAGTAMIADLFPGPTGSYPGGSFQSFVGGIVQAGDKLFFSANDNLHGDELFVLKLSGDKPAPAGAATAARESFTTSPAEIRDSIVTQALLGGPFTPYVRPPSYAIVQVAKSSTDPLIGTPQAWRAGSLTQPGQELLAVHRQKPTAELNPLGDATTLDAFFQLFAT